MVTRLAELLRREDLNADRALGGLFDRGCPWRDGCLVHHMYGRQPMRIAQRDRFGLRRRWGRREGGVATALPCRSMGGSKFGMLPSLYGGPHRRRPVRVKVSPDRTKRQQVGAAANRDINSRGVRKKSAGPWGRSFDRPMARRVRENREGYGFQPCFQAGGSSESISTKQMRHDLPEVLTQAWLVACCTMMSPAFRCTWVSSSSMSISPSSTIA